MPVGLPIPGGRDPGLEGCPVSLLFIRKQNKIKFNEKRGLFFAFSFLGVEIIM